MNRKDITGGDTVEAFYFDEFSNSLYVISKGKSLFVLTFRKGNYGEMIVKTSHWKLLSSSHLYRIKRKSPWTLRLIKKKTLSASSTSKRSRR